MGLVVAAVLVAGLLGLAGYRLAFPPSNVLKSENSPDGSFRAMVIEQRPPWFRTGPHEYTLTIRDPRSSADLPGQPYVHRISSMALTRQFFRFDWSPKGLLVGMDDGFVFAEYSRSGQSWTPSLPPTEFLRSVSPDGRFACRVYQITVPEGQAIRPYQYRFNLERQGNDGSTRLGDPLILHEYDTPLTESRLAFDWSSRRLVIQIDTDQRYACTFADFSAYWERPR